MTPLTVVGGILLAGDHLLGVEELAVGTSSNLIDDIGLQVDVDCARHVLALAWNLMTDLVRTRFKGKYGEHRVPT